jgi:hypothetical protein
MKTGTLTIRSKDKQIEKQLSMLMITELILIKSSSKLEQVNINEKLIKNIDVSRKL